MKLINIVFKTVVTLVIFVTITNLPAAAIDKLPADSIDQSLPPTGQIAFIRKGDVWVMDANSTNQKMVCKVSNADGSLSWSADNKRIVFTRSGRVDLKGPDLVGGRHKVYDLFICYLDSATAGNVKYRTRLTDRLGARGPQWVGDGELILFWMDMNANRVNSLTPNYQLCLTEVGSDSVEVLRPDWQSDRERFLVTPSLNSRDQIAFVFFDELQPGGLVVLPLSDISIPLDSVRSIAEMNTGYVAPSWSPDDEWLAFVGNYPDDSGLYIATPDLQQIYLVTMPPEKLRISNYPPSFSPDGKWLTFSMSDGSVWTCDVWGNNLRRLTRPGKDKAPCWSR